MDAPRWRHDVMADTIPWKPGIISLIIRFSLIISLFALSVRALPEAFVGGTGCGAEPARQGEAQGPCLPEKARKRARRTGLAAASPVPRRVPRRPGCRSSRSQRLGSARKRLRGALRGDALTNSEARGRGIKASRAGRAGLRPRAVRPFPTLPFARPAGRAETHRAPRSPQLRMR